MSFAIYTSCSVNYLPKARALAESLRRHQPDASLTLCLNDVVPDTLDLSDEPFDRVWLPADLGYDRAWIFQHSVMELCTAVKGRAMMPALAMRPSRVTPEAFTWATAAFTELNSESSQASGVPSTPSWSKAAWALAWVRAAPMT